MIALRHGAVTAEVALRDGAGGLAAHIDDRRLDVTVLTRTPAGGAGVESLTLVVDGVVHDTTIARIAGAVLVAIGGHAIRLDVVDDVRADAARVGASGLVIAPMPGKVVTVLVAAGDVVSEGQPLVVLEAMKMETTLAAEIAGTVVRLEAIAGATVDGGAVLAEIRPDST